MAGERDERLALDRFTASSQFLASNAAPPHSPGI